MFGHRGVEQRAFGTKRFRHADAGVLTLDYENFELPGDPGQRLITFTPADRSTQAALHELDVEAAR